MTAPQGETDTSDGRATRSSVGQTAKKSREARRLLTLFVASSTILVAVAATKVAYGVRIPVMTRDVAATAKLHPLTGVLSSLGILLWAACATTCFFSAIILRGLGLRHSARFLTASGALTAYLLVDDLFMIHDYFATQVLGSSETVVYVFIGFLSGLYIVVFRDLLRATQPTHFFLALAFLSLSVALDSILLRWSAGLGQWQFFVEDGAKWLGIVFWFSYFNRVSHRLVTNSPALDPLPSEF